MNDKYKLSRFNYYSIKDKVCLVYNFFTEEFFEINIGSYQKLLKGEYDSIPDFEKIVTKGILVDSEIDEGQLQTMIFNKRKYQNRALRITIAPTLDCNCRCYYCYEKRRSGKMSKEIQRGISQYVDYVLSQNGYTELHINWYGGEPLMEPEIIWALSKRLMKIAKKYSCEYSSAMTSNGILINRTIIKEMEKHRIYRLQIPMDGVGDNYDKVKRVDGIPSAYGTLKHNLTLLNMSRIKTYLRVNTTRENVDDVEKLSTWIKEKGLDNISFYLARIKSKNTFSCNDCLYLSGEKFALLQKAFLSENKSNLSIKVPFCSAEKDGDIVIDELGNIYKCWEDIGIEHCAIGKIITGQVKNLKALLDYMSREPYNDPRCRECNLFLICGGGCAKQEMQFGEKECCEERNYIDSLIWHCYNNLSQRG